MTTQTGWRWCNRCQALAYSGFGNGICFDDEAHYFGYSGSYVLTYGATPEGSQDGWRWCNRCQVLLYAGFGNGICHDRNPHDFTGSSGYSVLFGAARDGAQEGWRWCSTCQVLMFAGSGDGLCWDGQPHYPGYSRPYLVAFESVPSVPPPPPLPQIEVTEVGGTIGVNGDHFTAGGAVLLSFVRGGDVKKVDLRAGSGGRIAHAETVLDREWVGGTVLASDLTTKKFAVGRTVRSFPFIPTPADL